MTARWDDSPTAGAQPKKNYPKATWQHDAPGVDPYFRWALHSGWRSYTELCVPLGCGNSPAEIRIIAAAPCQDALAAALVKPEQQQHPLEVPAAYGEAVNAGGDLALHFSATLPIADADWLLANPFGLRWKLALPQRDAEAVANASPEGQFGSSRDPNSLLSGNVVEREVAGVKAPPGVAPMPGVLALVDHGCPFLNTSFQDGRYGTRIAALWDQGGSPERQPPRPGWPWRGTERFAHGREIGPEALGTITAAARGARGLDEYSVYRGIDHLIDYDDARRRVRDFTHGGHLLDVLAGATDPLTGAGGDPASEAQLVFVQLPLPAAMDSTGGSLAPHLLDGVRYAMSLCEQAAPLVVSISYGGQAGPHDGTSIIETAFEELLRLRSSNFAIVLAAGNARQAKAHARRVVRPNRSALLRCQLSAGDTTDSFVELWYGGEAAGAAIEVRARTPGGLWSPWVGAEGGREVVLREDTGAQDAVALLRHDQRVPNGKRAMVLLALTATSRRAGQAAAVAESGEWQIEVRLAAGAQAQDEVAFDAWIERDDPARGSEAVPPYFLDQLAGDELNTLSSIATGEGVLRVGGFNAGTGLMAAYSALGAAGVPLPEVLAACEQDEESASIMAAATRSGETMRMNGTSVAAPVLARRLFNAMRRSKSALDNDAIRKLALRLAGPKGDPFLTLPQSLD